MRADTSFLAILALSTTGLAAPVPNEKRITGPLGIVSGAATSALSGLHRREVEDHDKRQLDGLTSVPNQLLGGLGSGLVRKAEGDDMDHVIGGVSGSVNGGVNGNDNEIFGDHEGSIGGSIDEGASGDVKNNAQAETKRGLDQDLEALAEQLVGSMVDPNVKRDAEEEKRQLGDLTNVLGSLTGGLKRDTMEEKRQLGDLTNVLGSLTGGLKRDTMEKRQLGDLTNVLGSLTGGLKRDTEEKRQLGDLTNVLGSLTGGLKRDTMEKRQLGALTGALGSPAGKGPSEGSQQPAGDAKKPSAGDIAGANAGQDALAGKNIPKPQSSSPLGPLSGLLGGIVGKRGGTDGGLGALPKDLVGSLIPVGIGKRDAAKVEKRQLGDITDGLFTNMINKDYFSQNHGKEEEKNPEGTSYESIASSVQEDVAHSMNSGVEQQETPAEQENEVESK